MKFTKEDIEEIKRKIELLYPSKNDWQLSKCVLPIHGEEEVVIMQRGKNVRCNINDLYSHVLAKEFGAFINMDDCNRFPVMSVQEVIAYVDPAYRRKGMVVTFQTPEYHHDENDNTKGHPVWEIWQFTGELSQWNDLSKWVKINSNDINNIKVTGVKTEGKKIMLQVGSSWVDTGVNLNDLISIEKDSLDKAFSDTDSNDIIPSVSVVKKYVESSILDESKKRQAEENKIRAEFKNADDEASKINKTNIADALKSIAENTTDIENIISVLSGLTKNKVVVKKFNESDFNVANIDNDFFTMLKDKWKAIVIPIDSSMTVHYEDIYPGYNGTQKGTTAKVMILPSIINIDPEEPTESKIKIEVDKLHHYDAYCSVLSDTSLESGFIESKTFKIPNDKIIKTFVVIFYKNE